MPAWTLDNDEEIKQSADYVAKQQQQRKVTPVKTMTVNRHRKEDTDNV
jgi:hypothetical protein